MSQSRVGWAKTTRRGYSILSRSPQLLLLSIAKGYLFYDGPDILSKKERYIIHIDYHLDMQTFSSLLYLLGNVVFIRGRTVAYQSVFPSIPINSDLNK